MVAGAFAQMVLSTDQGAEAHVAPLCARQSDIPLECFEGEVGGVGIFPTPAMSPERAVDFHEPGNGDSGCVMFSMSQAGNDLVYGIIDFDNKNAGTEHSYAIDNYAFEPIYVAFLLINEKICTSDEIGGGTYKFVNLGDATDVEIQSMIDYMASQLSMTSVTLIENTVQCGKTVHVSEDYFTVQGHELEDRIKNKWPPLKAIAKTKDNLRKNYF